MSQNVLTRKHARKARKAMTEAEAQQRVIYAACKAANVPSGASVARQIAALESFVLDLKETRAELMADYGADAEKAALRLGVEIQNAVLAITRLKIEAARPAD